MTYCMTPATPFIYGASAASSPIDKKLRPSNCWIQRKLRLTVMTKYRVCGAEPFRTSEEANLRQQKEWHSDCYPYQKKAVKQKKDIRTIFATFTYQIFLSSSTKRHGRYIWSFKATYSQLGVS
ncbi:hypothetical protein Plhal304r1_c003g0013311 [Plasmopara halstedii]